MQKLPVTPTSRRSLVRWLAALAAASLAVVALAGCGSDSDSSGDKATTTQPSDGGSAAGELDKIPEATFVSEEVSGYDLVKNTQLLFTFEANRLGVNAGCNTMTSSYTFVEGVLKWSDKPAATMMACEDDLMAQDQWITELLLKGMDAKVTDKTITLTSGDVTIQLKADQP